MSILYRAVVLVLIAAPVSIHAQGPSDDHASALAVGVFAGFGSGPINAATVGVDIAVPVWRFLALRGEVSQWANGPSGTDCFAVPPESHRCSVHGWAGLIGVAVHAPCYSPIAAYGSVTAGQFNRDFLGDNITSRAVSLELGARARLYRRLAVRLTGRRLRVEDEEYKTLLNEDLRYTMAVVALEYTLPLRW